MSKTSVDMCIYLFDMCSEVCCLDYANRDDLSRKRQLVTSGAAELQVIKYGANTRLGRFERRAQVGSFHCL
jgi:hypothetical protein